MAGSINLFDETYNVSPNATTIAQYAAVVLDASGGYGDVITPSGTGAFALGFVQDAGSFPTVGGSSAPANTPGQSVRVRRFGTTKAIAAGAISINAAVQVSGTSGQVAAVTFPGTGATDTYVVGFARTAASAAGDLIEIDLVPGLMTQVTA